MTEEGSDYLLSNEHCRLQISSKGTCIKSFFIGSYPLLGVVARGDGNMAMTHPCSPNFGPERNTNFGLPQHGPMRKDLCPPTVLTTDSAQFRYKVNHGTYPTGLIVERNISLANRALIIMTTHRNEGEKELPVLYGEHPYFLTPNGWEEARLNGVPIDDLAKEDRVMRWQPGNILELPGLPKIAIMQVGLPLVNLWVGRNSKGEYDQHYFCPEPLEGDHFAGYFGSLESMLAPGKSRYARLVITTIDP